MSVRCIRCDTEFISSHAHTHVCPKCHFVFKTGDEPGQSELRIVRSSELMHVSEGQGLREEAEAKCAFHGDADAMGCCIRCGRPVCIACIVESEAGHFCEPCAENEAVVPVSEYATAGQAVPTVRPDAEPRRPEVAPIIQPPASGRPYVAWEHRRQIGRFNGLSATWQQSLFTPRTFFRSVPLVGDYRSPLLYGLFWTLVGMAGGVVWKLAFTVYPDVMLFLEGQEIVLSLKLSPIYGLVTIAILLAPLLALIMLFAACSIYHVFVALLTRRHAGFEATVKVICYSTGVNIFYFFPVVGGLIGGIWQLILVTVGLKEVHRFSVPLALCVALIPYSVLLIIGIAYMLWALGPGVGLERISLETLFSLLH